MRIRNKILMALLAIFLFIGSIITVMWYDTSRKLSDTYLENVSESTMLDAYHAFEYLLTDTSYMATVIAANEPNIIDPVENLNKRELMVNLPVEYGISEESAENPGVYKKYEWI